MLKSGLTSVTFRSASVEEIVKYCKICELSAIEWGSDVHAKPSDIRTAERIRRITEENGITVSSYGSYYRLGVTGADEFKAYAETANALNAPIIRIWGGNRPHADLSCDEYRGLINEVKSVCKIAKGYGVEVAFEYHNDSLTDSKASVLKAIEDVGADNLGTYYQYDPWISLDENYETLKAFLPYLKMVHVFNVDESINRYSIAEHGGTELWSEIIKILKRSGADVYMLFEFLKNETPEELKREAHILNGLLSEGSVDFGNK